MIPVCRGGHLLRIAAQGFAQVIPVGQSDSMRTGDQKGLVTGSAVKDQSCVRKPSSW